MLKHIAELGGAGLALAGGVYAYKRKKGMPATPVAPSNPTPPVPKLPPPGVVTPSSAPATVTPLLSMPATNIGGGVTETIEDGLDVMSGGDIGQGETDTNSTLTSTGDIGDVTTPDDGSSDLDDGLDS